MGPRSAWNHCRLSRVVALLVAIAAMSGGIGRPVAMPAAAQDAIELYRAEQFDYYFFYEASGWQIDDQSSEDGSEFARFSNGEIYVDYWALDAPDTSPEACLDEILTFLNDDPAILEIEALSEEGGPPQITNNGTEAVTELVVTVEGEDGRFKLATRESCQALEPGQSVLYTSVNVPAAVWNETQWFDDPWLVGYLPSDEITGGNAPVPVPASSGDIRGTLDARLRCGESPFFVIARSYGGGGNFVIDPASFAMVSDTGESIQATLEEWVYPDIPMDSSLVLGLDEIGLFRLSVPGGPNDLYYFPPDSSPVYLGTRDPVCTAAAAFNAPILIDLD
jgi:hypothetical protein